MRVWYLQDTLSLKITYEVYFMERKWDKSLRPKGVFRLFQGNRCGYIL
ncbi:MAG: hypothetical protein K0S61_3605, partial [Anaerocolumna sp.]|nr:hypothetical protein [Anaerocolumna sp.]